MNKTGFSLFLVTFSIFALAAAIIISGQPAAANVVHPVPQGGATINLGAGGNMVSLQLKNNTGRDAQDITATIYSEDGTAVPLISEMHLVEFPQARVDDNNNGRLDAGEDDNSLDPAGTSGRIIIPTGRIRNNDEVSLNLAFDGPTPAGTKLKVRFSYKDGNGRHWDLCAVEPVDGHAALLSVPIGSHLCNVTLNNSTQDQVTSAAFMLLASEPNAFVEAEVPAPYDNSLITVMEEMVTITFDPPLPPGKALDVNLELANLPGDESTNFMVETALQTVSNGRFIAVDEGAAFLLDLDGFPLDFFLPLESPADLMVDDDRFFVIDDDSVRIYDRDGSQQGLTIHTFGRADVQVDGDRIIVIDDDSVRIYDRDGSQQGLTIHTNGRGDVVAIPDCIIVIDDDSVRIYDRDGSQQGLTIHTNGRATVVVEGDRIVVIDDDSVRIYDCNGQQQGLTIHTNGRATVVATADNIIVIDDDSVRIYDRDGSQQGLTIHTSGRADVQTDGDRIVVIDDDSVRIFDTAGSQQGLTIGSNGRAGIHFLDDRIIIVDDDSVRISNRSGQQQGLTIPTQGRADLVPAEQRAMVIDDQSVRVYHVNGFPQSPPLPTAGRASAVVMAGESSFALYLPVILNN
jgi:WD40 repeat protein